jgi:glycolate oxidase FAD binding subunit
VSDARTSQSLWLTILDLDGLSAPLHTPLWRVSVKPGDGPTIAAAARAAFPARILYDWGGGLVWIAGPATAAAHDAVCAAARAAGGTWLLLRAPEALRAAVAVIPPEPPALAAITRRVKAAFDPKGILNPGRMFAGL